MLHFRAIPLVARRALRLEVTTRFRLNSLELWIVGTVSNPLVELVLNVFDRVVSVLQLFQCVATVTRSWLVLFLD